MYYWNRANFEGLKDIASALRSCGQEALAQYCDYREQGIRKLAFAKMSEFLSQAASYSQLEARTVCRQILELHAASPGVHQFLADPLRRGFIEPTLEEWTSADPQDPIPARWHALIKRDKELMISALALDPADSEVRARLVDWELSPVDHATHHLVESVLLGELDEVRAALGKARACLLAAPDLGRLSAQHREIEHFAQLLDDWEEYSGCPEGTFPDWCARNGRNYAWPTIVYYSP
ncbi:MAG: hypothetical protein AAGJ55_02975 [Cyanobacteria bacterium J06555_12]